MKAVLKGRVLAESDEIIMLEGDTYFPPESVKFEYLHESAKEYTCPWKGKARYFDIEIEGDSIKDTAWTYPEPTDEARRIKGYIAFSDPVQVTGS